MRSSQLMKDFQNKTQVLQGQPRSSILRIGVNSGPAAGRTAFGVVTNPLIDPAHCFLTGI
jgi:hypothetical protein